MMQMTNEVLEADRIMAISEKLIGFISNEVVNPKASSTTTDIYINRESASMS
jgi:hypothetical protein